MEDYKERFVLQKRPRNFDLSTKSDKTQKFNRLIKNESDNNQYVITLKLKSEKTRLILKCSAIEKQEEYSINFDLNSLKEKYMIFNVCKNLDDAYKIFMNLFTNEKAKISKTENSESISLNLIVPNYIENIDEKICLKIPKKVKNGGVGDGKFLTKILKENPDMNFNYDLIKTIDNLNKKDLAKDKEIQKLNVLLNDSMRDISSIRQDLDLIKKKLKISENVIASNISRNSNELNNNNISDKKEGTFQEREEKERSNEEEEEEEEEKESEKEDDNTEKRKEQLKKNLMKKNEDISKDKESENKIKISTNSNINLNSNINSNSNSNSIININSNSYQVKTLTTTPIHIKEKNFPNLFFLKNLTKKSLVKYLGDNNFAIFESINGKILLVYATNNNAFHVYDIEKDEIIKIVKDAHKSQISNFRYIRDNIYKRDLLLTLSDTLKNIKIWDIKNFSCILNIEKIYNDGFMFSACFLIDEINKKGYIISINYDYAPLKIYNFEGNVVKNIKNYDDKSYMVDTFFHPGLKKYFIVVGNDHFIKSYNFPEGVIHKKYYDNSKNLHMYFSFLFKDSEVLLIEVDMVEYLRVWNFDTGDLVQKILIKEKLKLRGICLWNKNYVLIGGSDKNIKIVDLRNEKIDDLKCSDLVCTIKKIHSNNYGDCLLLQGRANGGMIKMYKNL